MRGRYELRAIVNAIFYQNRTGCQWMYLPNDLPPWSAVYYYFRLWRDDGTDQAIHDLLRCQADAQLGRQACPGPTRHPRSVCSILPSDLSIEPKGPVEGGQAERDLTESASLRRWRPAMMWGAQICLRQVWWSHRSCSTVSGRPG
nr:transposase [Couchioplanes caeruleus]